MKEQVVKGPTICLHSGAYFNFLNPHDSDFTIEDIARGLSHICRFGGQCQRFYTVAEHSVHVSNIIEPEHAWVGLMHDAAEALIGDITKPLKELLTEYKVIEQNVEDAVMQRFGVPFPFPPEVKNADLIMLATEQAQAMGKEKDTWAYTEGRSAAVNLQLQFWTPDEAYERFLERYHELKGK